MSAPELDEIAHWDVIAAALTVRLGPSRVFKHGEVPGLDGHEGEVPPIFALLAIQRRFVAARKSSRRAESSGWRISVRRAAETVDEAAWAALRITEALDDVRLTIGSHISTPVLHETTTSAVPDPKVKRLTGLQSYTYAL